MPARRAHASVPPAAVVAVTVLLAALLAPLGLSSPAAADASGGVPGAPRGDASQLSLGYDFGCAIVADGSVRCWGGNGEGQLAQGNTASVGDNPGESTVRVDLGAGRTAVAVTAGAFHACALLDTGQVRCWGYNSDGQLGQGNTAKIGDSPGETTVGVDLGAGRTAVAVEAGGYHTCAILDTGQLRCWGYGGDGELGQGNIESIGNDPGETTVLVSLPRAATAVTAADYSTCVVLDTGQVRCWGDNSSGQLMQGNLVDVGDSPGETTAAVDTSGHTVLAISGGRSHFCAIYEDHTLHCWGDSALGQLGLGRTQPFGDDPGEFSVGRTELPAGRTAVAVGAGANHTCAVLDDGRLQCWGANDEGQLGQGNTTVIGDDPGEFTVPVDLSAPVRAVAGGEGFTCAVSPTGLRCWGAGAAGQLARGSTTAYGKNPGEVPSTLPAIDLGGQQVGRDSDGDGVRDAVDACPTVAGILADGCMPGALLKGKKVVVNTILTKTKASAKCPAKATVKVKTKTGKGRLTVTKKIKTRTVATGCLVKGKVKLSAKPKKSAKTKVTITGTKLKTKRLVAVRL